MVNATAEVGMVELHVRKKCAPTIAQDVALVCAQRSALLVLPCNVCARQGGLDSIVPCLIAPTAAPTTGCVTTEHASATTNTRVMIVQYTRTHAPTTAPTMEHATMFWASVFVTTNTTETIAISGHLRPTGPTPTHAKTTAPAMASASLNKHQTEPLLRAASVLQTLWGLYARACAKPDARAMADVSTMESARAMMDTPASRAGGAHAPRIAMTMAIAETECVCARMATRGRTVACSLMRPCRTSASSTAPLAV